MGTISLVVFPVFPIRFAFRSSDGLEKEYLSLEHTYCLSPEMSRRTANREIATIEKSLSPSLLASQHWPLYGLRNRVSTHKAPKSQRLVAVGTGVGQFVVTAINQADHANKHLRFDGYSCCARFEDPYLRPGRWHVLARAKFSLPSFFDTSNRFATNSNCNSSFSITGVSSRNGDTRR